PPFSFKGAYNVLAHLCNALTTAHKVGFHGGITASNVVVNKAGRVRIAEFGLPRIFPEVLAPQAGLVDVSDRAAVAPEMVKNPAKAANRADLFSLGAPLSELVTGKVPFPGMLPSKITPPLPADLDAVVTCLLASPEERIADPATLKQILAKILDTEEAKEKAFKAEAARLAKARAAKHPSELKKVEIDENEHRWLVTKGKLDFGPFTIGQVKEQIQKDEIVPGNIVIDQENGRRASVETHPLFRDLVLQAATRRDDARRVHVETTVVAEDKK